MKKQLKHAWIPIVFPVFIGLGLTGLLQMRFDKFPVLHIAIDFGTLAIFSGFLFSILFFVLYKVKQSHLGETRKVVDQVNNEHKQFLFRLDHELKNPLSTIRTGSAYLMQITGDSEPDGDAHLVSEMQKTITQIDSQSKRIGRLISDLRKLAELETCLIEPVAIDVNVLLSDLVEEMKAFTVGSERIISLSLPAAPWQLPNIRADEDLLYIAIRNIFDNAIKYTRSKDTIKVRAYENHAYISIEISDSGIGIPEKEIDMVWNRLYRAKNARTIPGNGLGLSMVQIITRRFGGECELRSRDGKGTVVTLHLPKLKIGD